VEHLVSELVISEMNTEKEAQSLPFVTTPTVACVDLFSNPCDRHALVPLTQVLLPVAIVCHDCELRDALERIDTREHQVV
jgi:hypothetical protein